MSPPTGITMPKSNPLSNSKQQKRKFNVPTFLQFNVTNIAHLKFAFKAIQGQSLINRGGNGESAEANVQIIPKSNTGMDIQGIGNSRIGDIPIVSTGKVGFIPIVITGRAAFTPIATVGKALNIQRGDQYPDNGKGKTVYPNGQKRAFKLVMDDTSTKVRGKQKSVIVNGHFTLVKFQNVLPSFTARTYKGLEWKTLLHVTLATDMEQDPHIPYNKVEYEKEWVNLFKVLPTPVMPPSFDEPMALSSQTCGIHQLQSDKQYFNVPQNNILKWGALIMFVDDEVNVTMGKRIVCNSTIQNAMHTSFINNGQVLKQSKEMHPYLNPWMSVGINDRGENVTQELVIAHCTDGEEATFGIPQENKRVATARLEKAQQGHKYQIDKHPVQLKLWYPLSKDWYAGIVTYKEVNGFMEKDKDNPIVCSVEKTVLHKGLKDGNSPPYLVPNYNVTNGWKNGEPNEEPIPAVADDIPNAFENYAKVNEMVKTVGWKQGAEVGQRKMQSDKKQAKLQSFSNILKCENGHGVPYNFSMQWMSLEALKAMQYFIFWKSDKIKNE